MVTFVAWIFFIRLKQKNILKSHKNLCENKDFWNIVISWEYTKIKTPFSIYADLQFLIEKTDGCKNDSEKSSRTNVSERISSGLSMSTI